MKKTLVWWWMVAAGFKRGGATGVAGSRFGGGYITAAIRAAKTRDGGSDKFANESSVSRWH